MIRIEPHLLWLGHAGDCRDMAKVLDAGIEAVVQLAAEEPPAQFPREIIVLRIPLLDGADNPPAILRLAVSSVEQLLASHVSTLLCCSAGMSRSPAIAACALARLEQKEPATSLEAIRTRLATDISPSLWRDLLAGHR
jgi:protein-tyrosine phosphatase